MRSISRVSPLPDASPESKYEIYFIANVFFDLANLTPPEVLAPCWTNLRISRFVFMGEAALEGRNSLLRSGTVDVYSCGLAEPMFAEVRRWPAFSIQRPTYVQASVTVPKCVNAVLVVNFLIVPRPKRFGFRCNSKAFSFLGMPSLPLVKEFLGRPKQI
jgi:hypothetical protein